MSLKPEAWAEIAQLWIAGDEPLGRIASRFGISHQQIVGRARREGWPQRGAGAAAGPVRAHSAAETLPGNANGTRRGDEPETSAKAGADPESPGPRAASRGTAGRRAEAGVAGEPPRKRNRRAARRAMVERLFDAMDVKLGALEERIAAGGDSSPADSERTTRALNTLVRGLEKLADYEGKIGKGKGRRNDKPRTAAADAERRRSELARRIQRLLDSR